MTTILLVNVPISVNSPRTAFPPLPLLVLGGELRRLREAGLNLECRLLDLDLLLKQGKLEDGPGFFAKAAKMVLDAEPAACFFSAHGINQAVILELAGEIKAARPGCLTVMGGVGATLQATDLIEHFPQLDLVIRGEGEPVLPELVRAILNGGDFSSVPSAVFRRAERAVENPRAKLLAGEAIPAPDYSLIRLGDYVEHNRRHPYVVPGLGLIETGRGCSWNCSFCAPAKMWGGRARYRPIPEIVKEMRYLAERGLNFSFFVQDNLDEDFIVALGTALVDQRVNIPWGCYARLHAISDSTAELMARSGCRLIFVGLETSNRGSQQLIRKVLDNSGVVERIARFNGLGMQLIASFIAGFDGESEAELNRTLEFALECSAARPLAELRQQVGQEDIGKLLGRRPNFCMVHPLCHMPGTDLYAANRSRLRFTELAGHHDSYGSYLLGPNAFQRSHWRWMFSPYSTHLSEEKVRYYYSTLRIFNYLNSRPYGLAWAAQGQGATPLELVRKMVDRLGEEFALRSGIAEFEGRAGALMGEDLGEACGWSAERVASRGG